MTSEPNVNYSYLFKYIIIGDSAVGKSNILLRYIHDNFNEEFQSTIGVEFGAKNIKIEDKIYRIQIWDTAGQETFRSITRAYYKNSVCAFVVYDITNRNSFQNVKSWIEDCRKQSPKTVFMVLIGNKVDLEDNRQVTYDEGSVFAEKNGMLFFETSAKTGKNIEEIFLKSSMEISKKIDSGFYDLSNDSCGIKQGANNGNITLNRNNNGSEQSGGYCCY
jgi:small GTP-binding protein